LIKYPTAFFNPIYPQEYFIDFQGQQAYFGCTFSAGERSFRWPHKENSRIMATAVSGTLYLDKIQEVVQVSRGKATQLMETCIWCLDYCEHKNGVNIKVVNDTVCCFYKISWPDEEIDIESVRRSFNKDDAIEDGAEAVAFLVSVEQTDFTAVERAVTTTGIDYWLGYKERDPNQPFHRAGRLEVSGIMKENPENKVQTRVKTKLKQTKPTDHTFKVYVIIVEFGQPYATMVLKR
jgi:hypothetical protein